MPLVIIGGLTTLVRMGLTKFMSFHLAIFYEIHQQSKPVFGLAQHPDGGGERAGDVGNAMALCTGDGGVLTCRGRRVLGLKMDAARYVTPVLLRTGCARTGVV